MDRTITVKLVDATMTIVEKEAEKKNITVEEFASLIISGWAAQKLVWEASVGKEKDR